MSVGKFAAPPPSMTETPEARLDGSSAIRKIGIRILPLLACGYGIAFMDRMNISFAALQMNRDLGFTASVYGFGAGLFFLSYAACEIPSNLLLLRFGARRWMARIMITWGILAAAMMFVRTPHQFFAMRFLLGVAEAGFFPGVIYYLTLWFPSAYRARAIGLFYIAFPLSGTVMGLLAGTLLGLGGNLKLAGWQWLFLLEGIPAILLGVLFLFVLPDGPSKARWLDAGERAWLLDRIASDDIAGEPRTGHEHPGRVVFSGPVLLVGLVFLFTLGSNYAYNFSAPLILQRLTGASVGRIGLFVAGMGLLGAISMLLNALHSDRTRERHLHVFIPCLLMAAGFTIAGRTMNPWLGIPALALSAAAFFAMQGPLLALATQCFSGRSGAAGIAAINTIAIMGGFLGPTGMGLARDFTGDYQRGLQALAVPILVAAGLVLILHRRSRVSEVRADIAG
jgi:ACS family tartrate transporter-like MFS transporter